MEKRMLAIYGFSLLCYVQRQFNSAFLYNSDGVEEVGEVEWGSEVENGAVGVYCVQDGTIIEGVESLWGGELPEEAINLLGEAALICGKNVVNALYNVSQWVPDRKRSALILTGFGKNCSSSSTIIASSIGAIDKVIRNTGINYGRKERNWLANIGVKVISVGALDCMELFLNFLDCVKREGLL